MSIEKHHHHGLQPGSSVHWYEIQRVLGQGGFGITYLARDCNLDQTVAIKEYLPAEFAVRMLDRVTVEPRSDDQKEQYRQGIDRFITEARTLARFNHPNIVRVYSVFEANNTAYMVMRYELGRSLHQVLQERRTLPEDEIMAFLLPILDGLSEVHQHGFIHRDIRPANLYLRNDKSPVLLDFGSARQTSGGDHALTVLVAPGYAPLEQYGSSGKRQGPWTDIYGLGATLYRAIAGVVPLDSLERYNGVSYVSHDQLQPAREIGAGRYSASLLRAIDHALSLRIKQRPQSIEEWLKDFREPGRPAIVLPSAIAKSSAGDDRTRATSPTLRGSHAGALTELWARCRRSLARVFDRYAPESSPWVWFGAAGLTLGLAIGAWHMMPSRAEQPQLAALTPAQKDPTALIAEQETTAKQTAADVRLEKVRAEVALAETRREDARRELAELESLRGMINSQQQQMQVQLSDLERLRKETAALKVRQEAAARDQATETKAVHTAPERPPAYRMDLASRAAKEAEAKRENEAAKAQEAANEAFKRQATEEARRRLEALQDQRAAQERELEHMRAEMARLDSARVSAATQAAPAPSSHFALAPAARPTMDDATQPESRPSQQAQKAGDPAAAKPGKLDTAQPAAGAFEPDRGPAESPSAPTADLAKTPEPPRGKISSAESSPPIRAHTPSAYRQAAEKGDTQAQFELARLYATGKGVPRDEFFAYVWYAVAARAGNAAAEAERKALARTLQPVQIQQAEPLVLAILAKFKNSSPAPAEISYVHRR